MSTNGEKKIARRIQKEIGCPYTEALNKLREMSKYIDVAKRPEERWSDCAHRVVVAAIRSNP